jgi:hypothetical protein
MRGLRQRNPQVRANDRRDSTTKNRALSRLASEYPARFNQLIDEERARYDRAG